MSDTLKAILIMVGFWGGFYLIAQIIELISKHFEKIRDRAAQDVLSIFNPKDEFEVVEALVNKSKISKLKNLYNSFKNLELKGNPLRDMMVKRTIREISIGRPCPECKVGVLVERSGKYGRFIGCSYYPACDYTLSFRHHIKINRENNREEIMNNIKKAYFKV